MLWAYIGTIYLLILLYQDYKNNQWVDDRYNYLMIGASIGLLYLKQYRAVYIFLVIAIGILFKIVMGKLAKGMGEADINSLSWIIVGFAYISLYTVAIFAALFTVFLIIYYAAYMLIVKLTHSPRTGSPLYYVITLAFVCTNALARLY